VSLVIPREVLAVTDFPVVTSEENSQYATIIDKILKEGDLNTISAKQIRKDLEAELGFDLSGKKVRLSVAY
jgi:restriction endonuclease S subunit